jgi:hypothetical protein
VVGVNIRNVSDHRDLQIDWESSEDNRNREEEDEDKGKDKEEREDMEDEKNIQNKLLKGRQYWDSEVGHMHGWVIAMLNSDL